MTLRVINWNVQWATPRSERSPEILRRIGGHSPALACLTETNDSLLDPLGGYTICSQADYGLKIVKGRRKVMLWSANPWRSVDCLGSEILPPGRFTAGTTESAVGDVTVIGICIPWSGSRTKQFGGTKRQWQDHEQYLDGIATLLAGIRTRRVVLMGDFNQPVGGRSNVPARLRAKLRRTIPPRMTVVTSGIGHHGKRSIDHIALSGDLCAESLGVISNRREGATRLSDHFGIVAGLAVRD